MKKEAIVGIGSTEMLKKTDRSATSFYVEASRLAIADSGLGVGEIDGIITCGSLIRPQFTRALGLAEYLGIKPRFAHDVDQGGASPVGALILASMAIKLGKAKNVLVTAADNLTAVSTPELIGLANKAIGHPRFVGSPEPAVPTLYDEWARLYLGKYSVSREKLAAVPTIMSKHARFHPKAVNKKVLTAEDVLRSKAIAPATNLLECARPASGGGALIVTTDERAEDCQNDAVLMLGTGESHLYKYLEPNFDKFSCCKVAGLCSLREVGVKIKDIKYAGIYDCFPISLIRGLEDLGFCGKGEGADYIWNGEIEFGKAKCPVNTHGGLLSHGAPWSAPAIFSVIEAVEQLRGDAGIRQVEDADIALVYANGGIFSSATVVVLGI